LSVLIKDIQGMISLNGENFLKEPKIFVSDTNQIRIQTTIFHKEHSRDVDIVIYNFELSKPSLVDIIKKNADISLIVVGEELKSKTDFKLGIIYQLGKEFPYYFKGTVGKLKISQAFETIADVLKYFCKMFDL